MTGYGFRRARGFSLVELVMVVFILAVVSGIAVPRVVHAGHRAQAQALFASIANVRQAVDYFQAEHGRFPGYNPATSAPDGTWFVNQLLQWSDVNGKVSTTPSADYRFGPYLRPPFPVNPVNNLATVRVRATHGATASAGTGWIACLGDGCFTANATDAEIKRLTIVPNELEQFSGAKLRGSVEHGGKIESELSP
jgi:prepilin-type N-terminal cleavage/methylation domain-containing protein